MNGPPFFVNEYVAPKGAASVCEIHSPNSADYPEASVPKAGYEARAHGEFQTMEEAREVCLGLGYTKRAVNQTHAVERWMRALS